MNADVPKCSKPNDSGKSPQQQNHEKFTGAPEGQRTLK